MDGTGQRRWPGRKASSIWMVRHCLQLLDEDFARDQYQRAPKRKLGEITLGFWLRTRMAEIVERRGQY